MSRILKTFKYYFSFNQGVSYIEIMVTIAVISIVSTVVITDYSRSEQRKKVIYTAQQIEQDIRKAQIFSLTGKKNSVISERPCGYGVSFTKNSSLYTVFQELCAGSNKVYDAGEEIENISLLNHTIINNLSVYDPAGVLTGSPNSLNVFFNIPFADIFINNTDKATFSRVEIEITNNAGFNKILTIKNNSEVSAN